MFGVLKVLSRKLVGRKAPQVTAVERRRKKRGSEVQPELGTEIFYRHLKMRVSETNTNELWKWLVSQGWRVVDVNFDRRNYVMLPDDIYERLDLAPSTERPMMIRALMRQHPSKK